MRVRVLEACKAYFNYNVHHLAEGQVVDGEFADHLLHVVAPVEPLADETAPDPGAGELDITAAAATVLAWVGDDPERAAEAFAAEQATEKPRAGLIGQLQKLGAA
jgi:hypothetical protein